MRLRIKQVVLAFEDGTEIIPLNDVSYFHGKIGTGKSSIGKLIDYCFGGRLVYTTALQQQFVAATLDLKVGQTDLQLTREANANKVRTRWEESGEKKEKLLSLKENIGETLSDLLFRLADCKAPRIRGGAELTFRELLRFCYLDQDTMDSEFFGLERDGLSREVLRALVGWHNDEVLALENELLEVEVMRKRSKIAAQTLREAFRDENLPSENQIEEERIVIWTRLSEIDRDLASIRLGLTQARPHAITSVQNKARELAYRIGEISTAIEQIREIVERDETHLNTLTTLKDRTKRAKVAHELLKGVAFDECPACFKQLPDRSEAHCDLCGQNNGSEPLTGIDIEGVDADIATRIEELGERIDLQKEHLKQAENKRRQLGTEKVRLDAELTEMSREYDSAYLSQALDLERQRSKLHQKLIDLEQPEKLSKRAAQVEKVAAELIGKEREMKERLKEAKKKAEEDRKSLELLANLFTDCLHKAHLPGLGTTDRVELGTDFMPRVYTELSTKVHANFDTLGGGKKVFFKCCFALAVHRLAARTNNLLPGLLIIDSPMKSISERENKEQFNGFHELLYDLMGNELKGTQVILIDKEMVRPTKQSTFTFHDRYMTLDDPQYPPLVPNYRGQ
ncbi:MAG TPA: hypothetical protein VN673_15455 [Clostridia bacterium]|nr:hypothetical protein [Clostridia bacterium]